MRAGWASLCYIRGLSLNFCEQSQCDVPFSTIASTPKTKRTHHGCHILPITMMELHNAALEASSSELTRDSGLTESASLSPTPKHARRSQRKFSILENIKQSSSNMKPHHGRKSSAYTGEFTHLTSSETFSSSAESGTLKSDTSNFGNQLGEKGEQLRFGYPEDQTDDFDAWTAQAFYTNENRDEDTEEEEYRYPDERDARSFPYQREDNNTAFSQLSFHTTGKLHTQVQPFTRSHFDLGHSGTEIMPYKQYSSPSLGSKGTRLTHASTKTIGESWDDDEETQLPSQSLVDLDSDASSECSSDGDESEEEEDDYQSFITDNYADGHMDGTITAVESFLDELGDNEGIQKIGNFFEKYACSHRESFSPDKHDLEFEEEDTDDETLVSIKRQTRGRSRSPRDNASVWTAQSALTEADTILEVVASSEEEETPSLLERVLTSCCDAYNKGSGAAL